MASFTNYAMADNTMNTTQPEIEREVKVLDINVPALLEELKKSGAVKKYETKMRIVSYDFASSRLYPYDTESSLLESGINGVLSEAFTYYGEHGALKDNNAHLRLRYREDDEMAELCFKHNTIEQGAHKIAFEYNFNIPISVAQHFEQAALGIGLVQVALHEKKRESYRLIDNGCVCDIDTYPGLPTYVEIEHAKERVIDITIAKLKLDKYERSTKSGREFFRIYNINYYSVLTF